MANYVSQHTGTEIDTAVSQTLTWSDSVPWKVLAKSVTKANWTANSDSGHSAAYVCAVGVQYENAGYNANSDIPMVWFMDTNGGRYYADYVVESNGSVKVYSNTQIEGKICILGLANATGVS